MIKYTIIVAFVLLFVWTLYYVSKDGEKVYAHLDTFRERAKLATSETELNLIKTELIGYANLNCWNKHYFNHAKNILEFINGRLSK
jgi:hypothetical protein